MLPVLLHLGPLEVHTWGFAFAVAFMLGLYLAARRAPREGIDGDRVIELGLVLIVGAFVGARILYVILEWPTYAADPLQIFRIDTGGLSFHGGVLGGFVAGCWYARRHRIPVLRAADLMAPYIALGYSIVRIGCFANGCCYGVPTAVPWAFDFGDGILRHPTQLYSSFGSLAIFLILLQIRRFRPFDGYVWFSYLALYSALRFVVEAWREAARITPWLTVAQAASLAILLGSIAVIAFLAIGSRRVYKTSGHDAL